MANRASTEVDILWPYILKKLERIALTSGSGGGSGTGLGGSGVPNPHGLNSSYHSGTLADTQAPQFLKIDGSRSLTGNLSVSSGITIDGVDLSVHAANPNAHHNRDHDVVGSTHTITGSAYQLVGATGTNTLGLLTPSYAPGAAAAILRTDGNGGLQLDTNLLYVDAVNNNVGINRTPSGAALDVLVTSNADHTLRVKQKSGQTGRLWRVEDASGNELIVLNSVGDLQSGQPGFVSGLTGWQISHQGNAEFNNIWARGELHATVFVKDEVHATGGTLLVKTAGKLYDDAAIDSTTVDTDTWEVNTGVGGFGTTWDVATGVGGFGTTWDYNIILNYIDIEDPPSGPGLYFQRYDVVRSKTEIDTGVTDFWLEVIYGRQMDGYSRYSITKRSGTDGTIPAGTAIVEYGQVGDGVILLTSDLNYAPYIDVFTVGPNVWAGDAGSIVPHMRMGRLDGVGVTAVSGIEQYGMIAGTDLSNANAPYIVASNLQVSLYKVDLTLNDGVHDTGQLTAAGELVLGSNIGTDAGKHFQVVAAGDGTVDIILGHLSGSYVHFDESEETLTVNASLELGGLVGNSLVVGQNGYIKSDGLGDYNEITGLLNTGFFLGWDATDHKFFVGGLAIEGKSAFTFDGSYFSFDITDKILLNLVGGNTTAIGFKLPLAAFEYLSYGLDTATALTYSDDFYAETLIAHGDRMRIETTYTPASAGATGTKGDICFDGSYLYIAINNNTWRRIAHATW